MLRNKISYLCNILFTVLLLGSSGFSTANAETVLKIATVAPDSTTWMKVMREGAEKIEARTAGRVKIKYYPGGVMGNDQAVLRKIRIGQLHGGAVTSGALAEVLPDAQLYSVPFEFRNIEEINYVRQQMDEKLRESFEGKGLVNIGITNGGFAYFTGTQPAASIEDLRKYKVWVPQGDIVSASVFKAADITPVSLPISDVYTALQTGLLETVIGNPASIIAFQWHSKVKYLTDSPIVFIIGMMVVDKKAFSKISPDDQKIVRAIMQENFRLLDDLNQRDNSQALQVLKANGIEFIKPTPEEAASWRKLSKPALQTLNEKNNYNFQHLSEMRKHLGEYRSRQATLNE